jgi:hypothetical protein
VESRGGVLYAEAGITTSYWSSRLYLL